MSKESFIFGGLGGFALMELIFNINEWEHNHIVGLIACFAGSGAMELIRSRAQ